MDLALLEDRLKRGATRGNLKFTLEPGQGETYHTAEPTLYGHGKHQDGVMKGRPLRVFINSWQSWNEAEADLQTIGWKDKIFITKKSSHIPMDDRVAHLTD